MKNLMTFSVKTTVLFLLSLWLQPVVLAQTERDSVTITGTVSDYDGKAIENCSVMFQNSNFDVLFETKTDKHGKYRINIPKGRYANIGAIDMDTYPHTMQPGTTGDDLRLEFWGWNFIADRDTTLDIRYHRMEAYGLHAFQIPGGMPTYQIYVRPMSLTRFLANKKVQEAQHKQVLSGVVQEAATDSAKCDNMAPSIDRAGIRVWIDGKEVSVLMKQQIKEYYEPDEYGIAYYLTVEEPAKPSCLPYRVFKVELTDLDNGDKGEAIYYLERANYIESK